MRIPVPWALRQRLAVDRLTARPRLLSGMMAGFAAGVGARIGMRLVALDAGMEPTFTLGGTLFILLLGAVQGAPLGLLFATLRKTLPGPDLAKGLAFGGLLLVVFLTLVIPFLTKGDSALEGELAGTSLITGINVFVMAFISYGIVLGAATGWLERRAYAHRTAGWAAVTGDGLLIVTGILGVMALLFETSGIVAASVGAII